MGLTGIFAYNIFFFRGLETVPAGQAAAVIAMNPAAIALLSMILFGERGGGVRLLGIAISLIGALIVISNGQPLSLLQGELGAGRLDIVMCVFSWVAYSLIGKRVLDGLSPLVSVTYASTAGMLMLAWPVWTNGTASHWLGYGVLDWSSLFYLGLGGTVIGFVWYYRGIQRIGAMRASVFINFVPVSAILLGHLLLGEAIGWPLALGAMLVITGVYLTNRPQSGPGGRYSKPVDQVNPIAHARDDILPVVPADHGTRQRRGWSEIQAHPRRRFALGRIEPTPRGRQLNRLH